MQDTAKYLIHANIAADGVVERSDVVGAIFGQTEGLLGDDLDLRDLQDASKVGRIDVDITSKHGQSFGDVTIATSLDKVETAILAAALETIDRVGPCKSTIEVDRIEDVRAAKRREVVERAQQLLRESFEGSVYTSEELVEEVRTAIRVEDATEHEGLPAGPRVADSDAVIVVEGRADVLQLLQYGVKNAVAVEGTDVPDAIADLTRERTVTAFLDGDRGGDLILKELVQVGDVDHVAFAPPDRSVEDLDRHEVMAALRDKVPYGVVADADDPRSVAATDGSASPAPDAGVDPDATPGPDADADVGAGAETGVPDDAPGDVGHDGTGSVDGAPAEPDAADASADDATSDPDDEVAGGTAAGADTSGTAADDASEPEDATRDEPETLRDHVRQVVSEGSGRVRLLGADFGTLAEDEAAAAFDLVRDAEPAPSIVVLDDEISQRVLDVAAQRGVDQIVAAIEGEFVKSPASVRVRTADELQVADE